MMCKGIYRTNPNFYYVITVDGLSVHDKCLEGFDKLNRYSNMHTLIKRLADASKGMSTSAVITGGTDSRSVLSHLYAWGVPITLSITGQSDDPDVLIAKEIAERLDLRLLISDERIADEGIKWTESAFEACDGVTSMLMRYRLHKKNVLLNAANYEVEFGGVGGEIYKNSFINQDIPFYSGKPQWNKFYYLKIAASNFPDALAGAEIKQPLKDMQRTVLESILPKHINERFPAYTEAGYKLLQYRMSGITNADGFYYASEQPLMERDCVALVYGRKPHSLEMQRFQRNEVTTYCAAIANIKTDRKNTLNSNENVIRKEIVGNYLFLISVAADRVFRRNRAKGRVDDCFEKGLQTKYCRRGIEKCKEIKVLADNVDIENIPYVFADRFATIGLLFETIGQDEQK